MKHLKMLGLAAVAAAALMAFVGVGTASATKLIKEGGATVTTGSTIGGVNEGVAKLTTSFKNIECSKSNIAGKTTNESGATVNGNVETLTFEECNCEVKVLKKGTLSIAWTSGSNGSLTSSGAEVTATCSSIFGNVHCIYVTSATSLGTLTGSSTTKSTARVDITASIPRLSTNGLCDEESTWHVQFSIDHPDWLDITS